MEKVFTAHFGPVSLRFVRGGADIFVSKIDLFNAISDCLTQRVRALGETFLERALSLLADGEDRRGAVLGDSVIGPAIHFHAAANLLASLSDLINVDENELRESAFRVATLMEWYCGALYDVTRFFGMTANQTLNSVSTRLDRLNPAFVVNVIHDGGMWVGECGALHLATEAPTYEELVERVWAVTPDIIETNRLNVDVEAMRIRFEFDDSAQAHKIAL